MRKRQIISAAVAAVAGMSLLLPSAVSAQSLNSAGCCKTVTTIKKAATPVKHDGIISDGEYEEIQIVRDTDDDGFPAETCDLLFAWAAGEGYSGALDLLQSIKFYVSWDETNGVNFAVSGTIPEVPHNENTSAEWPENKNVSDEHGEFPGDEFIYQLGAMFRVEVNEGTDDNPKFESIINRGFTRNTSTGEMLYGWYWEHGIGDYLKANPQTAGVDYDCKIDVDSHYVVYEISYPFAAALTSGSYNGTVPNDGAKIYFDMSLVGGGKGKGTDGNDASYAVSLGDGGYMTTLGAAARPATGVFSSEVVGGGTPGTTDPGTTGGTPGTTDPGTTGGTPGTTDPGTTGGTPGTTTPGTTTPGTTQPGTTTPGTTDPGTTGGTPGTTTPGTTQPGTTTPGTTTPGNNGGTPGTTNPGTTTPGNNNNPNNSNKPGSIPQTGDAMAILAALSALSAGGAMIFKKRR